MRAHYARLGIHCVATCWRGTRGEIDLILKQCETLIFVEVKRSKTLAQAATRLSAPQQRRIVSTAEEFLVTSPKGALTDMRFDLALMDRAGTIEIRENILIEL